MKITSKQLKNILNSKVIGNMNIETSSLYGVEEPEESTLLKTIWNSGGGLCKFIIIPIILLIGSIIGLKKIKNGKGVTAIILDIIRIISIISIIIILLLSLLYYLAKVI